MGEPHERMTLLKSIRFYSAHPPKFSENTCKNEATFVVKHQKHGSDSEQLRGNWRASVLADQWERAVLSPTRIGSNFSNSTASYPLLSVPLTVDVTTGDKITPGEIEYSFRLMFDSRSIYVMAYNLETSLSEKLETILSRNIVNTRPRDFYDIHVLYAMRGSDCDIQVLRQAFDETETGTAAGLFCINSMI